MYLLTEDYLDGLTEGLGVAIEMQQVERGARMRPDARHPAVVFRTWGSDGTRASRAAYVLAAMVEIQRPVGERWATVVERDGANRATVRLELQLGFAPEAARAERFLRGLVEWLGWLGRVDGVG